jgi:uncharacterized membrane protein YgcG
MKRRLGDAEHSFLLDHILIFFQVVSAVTEVVVEVVVVRSKQCKLAELLRPSFSCQQYSNSFLGGFGDRGGRGGGRGGSRGGFGDRGRGTHRFPIFRNNISSDLFRWC